MRKGEAAFKDGLFEPRKSAFKHMSHRLLSNHGRGGPVLYESCELVVFLLKSSFLFPALMDG